MQPISKHTYSINLPLLPPQFTKTFEMKQCTKDDHLYQNMFSGQKGKKKKVQLIKTHKFLSCSLDNWLSLLFIFQLSIDFLNFEGNIYKYIIPRTEFHAAQGCGWDKLFKLEFWIPFSMLRTWHSFDCW